MSDFALGQLQALAALREFDAAGNLVPWVFPNSRAAAPTTRSKRDPADALDAHVCIKSFGKQLRDRQCGPDRRMINRTKSSTSLVLPGGRWTAHDLRRTAATMMARLGVSVDVIDECLNHKLQSRVARVYIKDRRLGEQARAFDALGARINEITTGGVGV